MARYQKTSGQAYMLKRKWKPIPYGLCPKCESEVERRAPTPSGPRKPPEKPPPVVEIKPKGKKVKGIPGKKKPKKGEPKPKPGKPEKAEKEKPGKPKKPPKLPFGARPEDIAKAKKGSQKVKEEFEKAKDIRVDKTTPMFKPVSTVGAPSVYKDQNFITKMRHALRDWRAGYREVVKKRGQHLKVKEYIRSGGKVPFVSRERTSAKGRKILVVADFSGSMVDQQEEYKKAIISAMQVLDEIGTKTALFGFGGEKGDISSFFFKVKKFEEPMWTDRHAARTAALEATYPATPTSKAYKGLERYIKRHRPDVVLTVTDGGPDNRVDTKEAVDKLKRNTRMVAFGIGSTPEEAKIMADNLRGFNYHKILAVSSMRKLPKELVDLMAPT